MSDIIFELSTSIKNTSSSRVQPVCVIKPDDINPEVNKLIKKLENLRIEQMKYSLVCDCMKQCFKDDLDNQELCKKIHDTIASAEIYQYICSDSKGLDPKNTNLLGLIIDEDIPFTFQEQETIRDALELKLIEKFNTISKEIKLMVGNYDNTTVYPTNIFNINLLEDKLLLSYKEKLNQQQELYVKNLMEQTGQLEEIINSRTQILPKLCEDTIRETTLKQRMHDLKTRILNGKSRVDIFTETNTAIDAYRILIMDIKKEQIDCQLEINNFLELKQRYKEASSKEYNEILQSYLELKRSMIVMKDVYDRINSK